MKYPQLKLIATTPKIMHSNEIMKDVYAETIGLCPTCGKDSPAFYREERYGMVLFLDCIEHGQFIEKVESDSRFFKERYALEYDKCAEHLVLPLTYRCNMRCRYCYTLSNATMLYPEDRIQSRICEIIRIYKGNIMLSGGEPTLRNDLFHFIRTAKAANERRKISIATNGLKLKDIGFVRQLRDSGLDFVFLSCNDKEYEKSKAAHDNKIVALDNCQKTGIPVWISRIIEHVGQVDSLFEIIERYKKTIFQITIRSPKPFGVTHPVRQVYVSDILKYLRKESEYAKGRSPFNVYIRLQGKKVKITSWVNDMKRLDPIDDDYLISNDTVLPFHRGKRIDELLLFQLKFNSAGK